MRNERRNQKHRTIQIKCVISPFFPVAIDLINNLLQVKLRKRYSVDKSLSHVYLQVTLDTCREVQDYWNQELD